jgi:hypothetical protein
MARRKMITAGTFRDNIAMKRQELDWEEEAHLRKKGWSHTCDVPGSFWLWSKVLKTGRTILVDRSLALRIQSTIDFCGE